MSDEPKAPPVNEYDVLSGKVDDLAVEQVKIKAQIDGLMAANDKIRKRLDAIEADAPDRP